VGGIGVSGGEMGVMVGTVCRRGSIPGAAHNPLLERRKKTTSDPVSTKMNLFTILPLDASDLY
jgi:hypothetical protein